MYTSYLDFCKKLKIIIIIIQKLIFRNHCNYLLKLNSEHDNFFHSSQILREK